MQDEIIGEFTGRTTAYKVLPDGKIEIANQGKGKFLGLDASLVSSAVGTMANGLFIGEVNSTVTTKNGGNLIMKSNAFSWYSEKEGETRTSSIQTTQLTTISPLNKAVCLHEYVTDKAGNWFGKIYRWK